LSPLTAIGADLSAYNSTESAADVADLRKVLGYAAWNIYGTSYGSYLAQTIMRNHPAGIRSVVLDSVLPPTYSVPANWWNTRAGFDNLFQACAAEPACDAARLLAPETRRTFANQGAVVSVVSTSPSIGDGALAQNVTGPP
jgi:pimeloyl-ACP methyl ester carboxylesterase